MVNALRILVVWLSFAVFCGAALAQGDGFDFTGFDTQASRAEEVIAKGDASSQAFETLRTTLSKLRSAALNEGSKHTDRVATLRQQLAALGPEPEEGIKEVPEIASRRASLNGQLADARAPIMASEEAYRRADGLISEIDTLIRTRRTTALLTLGPSPLVPGNWAKAWDETTAYIKSLRGRISTALTSPTRRAVMAQNMPVILGLMIAGLLLLFRARQWVAHGIHLINTKRSSRLRALLHFCLSLSLLILPVIGLFLVTAALSLLSVLEGRDEFLVPLIRAVGVILLSACWLANFLFIPDKSENALFDIPGEDAQAGRLTAIALGYILALAVLLRAVAVKIGFSAEANVALLFPLVLLGGIGLLRIGFKLETHMTTLCEGAAPNPLERRFFRILANLCYLAGAMGPLLAAVGYFQAGSRLVFSSIASLALFAACYILLRLVIQVTRSFSAPKAFRLGEEDQAKSGALFRILLAFAFISATLPLLALIWGARVSDLSEVWIWLSDGISLGDTRLSLVDFLTFVLIFGVGYTITRLLQGALRTLVLPNTRLDAGGRNAITTGTGYVGIFLAAVAAITATGLDLSNLALVAGALSVGIGFGLQTVVSNFVSGIILLIERPIKEGDWIDVGGNSGYVRRISVRSTSIDTFDRATVIVPNADLIAGTVTNWTHGNMSGRVKVPVGVSYDADPRQVEKILQDVAEDHPMVLRDPAPNVIFIGFGASSMDFEIRAILRDVNWMLSAHSDMNFEIVRRFREAGIEIPFPQRDLNLRNIGSLAQALKPSTQGNTS